MSNKQKQIKMENLTKSQIEKLTIVLNAQFKGEIILFGESSINENKVYSGRTKWIRENQKNSFETNFELGGAVFGNNIKNLKIWNWLNLSYSQFYTPRTINVEMLKNNYSNGIEVINQVLNNL